MVVKKGGTLHQFVIQRQGSSRENTHANRLLFISFVFFFLFDIAS